MKIFCPYAIGKLHPKTEEALVPLGAEVSFVPLEDEFAYHRYWQRRWQEGERFINVEHDCAPTIENLRDLWSCPHEWCSLGYNNDLIPFFGCVKFSIDFIRVHRNLWDVPLMDWKRLDSWLAANANVYFKPHLHGSMWHAKRHPGDPVCSPINAAKV